MRENKPFLPEVGKSGASVGMSLFVYRNAVVDGPIRLGAKWPDGIKVVADETKWRRLKAQLNTK